jgi:hypothetical protein
MQPQEQQQNDMVPPPPRRRDRTRVTHTSHAPVRPVAVGVKRHEASAPQPATRVHTGAHSLITSLGAMTDSPGKRAAAEALSPARRIVVPRLEPPNEITFVLSSGERFTLSRQALESYPKALLARLADSEVPTERDESGAIKIGYPCSAQAFERAIKEHEWYAFCACRDDDHFDFDPENDPDDLDHIPLRAAVHPRELALLWDYLGMPKSLLCTGRTHLNTPLRVLSAQAAMQRGIELTVELGTFVRAVTSTMHVLGSGDVRLFATTDQGPPCVSFGIYTAGDKGVHHFTDELFELLQRPVGDVFAFCEQHLGPERGANLARMACGLRMRPCSEDDQKRIARGRVRVMQPLLDAHRGYIPRWMDFQKRPLGCFAVAVRSDKFYVNGATKPGYSLAHKYVDVPTVNGTFAIDVCICAGQDWADDEPDVDVRVRLTTSELTTSIRGNWVAENQADYGPVVVVGVDHGQFNQRLEADLMDQQKRIRRVLFPGNGREYRQLEDRHQLIPLEEMKQHDYVAHDS